MGRAPKAGGPFSLCPPLLFELSIFCAFSVSLRSIPVSGARTESNASLAQSPRHGRGNLWRAGSVAMNAKSLRVNGDLRPVVRNHGSFLADTSRLAPAFPTTPTP